MNKNPSPYKNKRYEVGEVYIGINTPAWEGRWIKLDGSVVNYPIPPYLMTFLRNGGYVAPSKIISTVTPTTSGIDIAYDGVSKFMTGVSSTLLSSTDGLSWKTETTFTTAINGVKYGNGIWLAIDRGGRMIASTDSVTWVTRAETFPISSFDERSIAYGLIGGQPMWVIPSGPSVSGNTYVKISTDTISWTSVSANQTAGTLNVVAYNGLNSTFVAAGTGSSGIRYSTDAVTWNTATQVFFSEITSITSNNTIFVAGSNVSNGITWSTDGISWSTANQVFATAVRSLSYMNGLFLQGSDNGIYRTSTLGYSSYTNKDTGLATSLNGIAYKDNVIITNSPLGISYGPETSYSLPTLSYGNNVFGWLNI